MCAQRKAHRSAAKILIAVLSMFVLGCEHPFQVRSTSFVSTDRVPVEVTPMAPFQVQSLAPIEVRPLAPVEVRSLTPIEVKSDEIPVKVDGGTPVNVQTQLPTPDKQPLQEMVVREGSGSAKIAIIDVDGVLQNGAANGTLSAGENPIAIFREKLEHVASGDNFSAIILRINSPGGGVTATDIMWRDLRVFQQNTGMPVVACLMDVGTGGGYYLACACDEIVAHPTSVVGGVGVILNLYNLEDALAQLNIVGVPVKAGDLIDMGSPLRAIPTESRDLLQGIAQEFHERFQGVVTGARPELDDSQVFDGRVMTARSGLDAGLVDRLGYIDDAIDVAMERANCDQATAVLLHRPSDQANTVYDVSAQPSSLANLLPNIPGVDRSQLPTFLYMWQPEPTMAFAE